MITRDLSTTSFHVNVKGHDTEDQPLPIPTLTIIYHPDRRRIGERLQLSELLTGQSVAIARHKPAFAKSDGLATAPLNDEFLSRKPVFLEPSTDGSILLRVDQSRTKVSREQSPIRGASRIEKEQLVTGVVLTLADRVVLLLHLWITNLEPSSENLGLVGRSNGINRVRGEIKRVADLDMPVLITGESGTGKELVAKAIHENGPFRKKAFVSVSMGAIPPQLAASELFGAIRGAYTGSTQNRLGLFRQAHGGTLFLDEIGEAPVDVQVMLLRVLETGEIFPVGSQQPIAVKVRIVAATDAKLEEMADEGKFKLPLLHRLAGYEIRLPALRDRRDDFGHLFFHFLLEELGKIGELNRLNPVNGHTNHWLPPSIVASLCSCHWPGNIRQLRNVVRQIVVSNRGLVQFRKDPKLKELLEHNDALSDQGRKLSFFKMDGTGPKRKPAHLSEEEIIAALRTESWDISAASKRLNISRPSLYRLIQQSDRIVTVGELNSTEIADAYRKAQGNLAAAASQLKVSLSGLKRRVKELKLDCADP